ncbi:MAG: ferredoxin [Pseudomonadota bacterium]
MNSFNGEGAEFVLLRHLGAAHGLALTGAFHPTEADAVPSPARTLALFGYGGPALWDVFAASPEATDGTPNPLDRWSQRVAGEMIDALQAQAPSVGTVSAYYPFGGPPYSPFFSWAAKAEPVWSSPIGPLVHAERGLWVSYRFALAIEARLDLPKPSTAEQPCTTCDGQPCTTACPVDAFGPGGYDTKACAAHIASPAGAECLERGCLARRACPVGQALAHRPDQATFHMRAFLRARQADPS